MGQNQRRPGFLRWGEGARTDGSAATEEAPDLQSADAGSGEPAAQAEQPMTGAAFAAATPAAAPEPVAPAAPPAEADAPFLRDLVGAMRGVAETSRDSSLESLRRAVGERVEELTASGAGRAEELRRRSELDVTGIGEWERSEIERVRREAEERRTARRTELEKELAEHQAAVDRDVEAARARLEEHERELDAFFAQLSEITDPTAFVAAAKRMPPPPDLAAPASARPAAKAPAEASEAEGKAAPEQPQTNGTSLAATDETLSERLAQLDERLASTAPGTETSEAASAESPAPAVPTTPAATATTATATTATATATAAPPAASSSTTAAADASTPIVVKGLGSFGAITSFKQALEGVDGIRGVTLSLGPTGDFVYRASHAADFDILAAIRSIEGPSTGIEESEGQVRVTIERPR
jgi:hypothetical protein